jgi:CHASE2 domain-containing sensor protein
MKQGSKRLRSQTLAQLGGAKHIVQKHLDEAMSVLPAEEQRVAAAAFHYLVTPEGTKIAQSVQALAVYSGCAAEDIERVLAKLASEDTRIVRPMAPPPDAHGGTRYVIFHDVLGPAILDWRARHEQARLEREKRDAERKREEAERRHRELLAATERRRRFLLLAVALAALVLSLGTYATGALDPLELETVDARFSIRGVHAVPDDIAVVGIDDTTLSDYARFPYPFPRRFHARLVDRLHRAGAKLIVYDVEFRAKGQQSGDDRLVAAMHRARPVILGVTALHEVTGEPDFLGGQGRAYEAGARPASVLVPPDSTVRKFHYEEDELKTVGIAVAETLAGRMIEPSEVGGDDIWIDYVGPTGTIPELSFSEVAKGDFPPDTFRDKIVVIGGTSLDLQDRHLTSMGGDLMSGPEIQANAITSARRLAPLKSAAGYWTVVLIVLFSILPPLMALLTRPLVAFAIAVGVFALYLGLVQNAFSHGWILPVVYPAIALVVALFGTVGLLRNRVSG